MCKLYRRHSHHQAKNLCRKLRKPSECNTKTLASLFPAYVGKGKRKFDPDSDCVFEQQQRRKKAVTPSRREKCVKMVVLESCSTLPRGSMTDQLERDGQIKQVSLGRFMNDEVKDVILKAFKNLELQHYKYLQCSKGNVLCVYEKQNLNGSDAISLAGSGCLYLQQSLIIDDSCTVSDASLG